MEIVMRLGGKKPPANVKTLVLPREGGEPVVLKAGAVTSMEQFEKLCPDPVAPSIRKNDGTVVPDLNDVNYKLALAQMGSRRLDYIVIKSLEATPDLTWENVDINNPETWHNWRKECQDSGFSVFEVNRIVGLAIESNSLSEEGLEEARKSFLAGQAQA
jgi:hypothetical protein